FVRAKGNEQLGKIGINRAFRAAGDSLEVLESQFMSKLLYLPIQINYQGPVVLSLRCLHFLFQTDYLGILVILVLSLLQVEISMPRQLLLSLLLRGTTVLREPRRHQSFARKSFKITFEFFLQGSGQAFIRSRKGKGNHCLEVCGVYNYIFRFAL